MEKDGENERKRETDIHIYILTISISTYILSTNYASTALLWAAIFKPSSSGSLGAHVYINRQKQYMQREKSL